MSKPSTSNHDKVMLRETDCGLRSLICQTMPSAGIASGWMLPVDLTGWIRSVSERFPMGSRPENLGLTALHGWLKDNGVECGLDHARALRKEWIADELREFCRQNPDALRQQLETATARKAVR